MKAWFYTLLCLFFLGHLGNSANPTRAVRDTVDDGGRRTVMTDQPNKDHGVFELKVLAPSGEIDQWYQHWVDSDGKVLIDVLREARGARDIPAHAGIRLITYFTYRDDGNVSDVWEIFGGGALRKHVVHRYDQNGKWIGQRGYDASGHLYSDGKGTPPAARLYGQKRRENDMVSWSRPLGLFILSVTVFGVGWLIGRRCPKAPNHAVERTAK